MMLPHVVRIPRAGAEGHRACAESRAGAGDGAEFSEPVAALPGVGMNHVKRAGHRRDFDPVFRRGLANAVGQFGFDPIGEARQARGGEVELNATQAMLRDGGEDFFQRRPRKGFGEDAELHSISVAASRKSTADLFYQLAALFRGAATVTPAHSN
jgi:hypothetical protein